MVLNMDSQSELRKPKGVWKADFPDKFICGRGRKLQFMCATRLKAKEFEQKVKLGKVHHEDQMTNGNMQRHYGKVASNNHTHKQHDTLIKQTPSKTVKVNKEIKTGSLLDRGVMGYVKRRESQARANPKKQEVLECQRNQTEKREITKNNYKVKMNNSGLGGLVTSARKKNATANIKTVTPSIVDEKTIMSRSVIKGPNLHSSPKEQKTDKETTQDISISSADSFDNRSFNSSASKVQLKQSPADGWKDWGEEVVAPKVLDSSGDSTGLLEENDDLNDALVNKYVMGWNQLQKGETNGVRTEEAGMSVTPQKLFKMTTAKSTTNDFTLKVPPGSIPGQPKTRKEKWGGHEIEAVKYEGWGDVNETQVNWYEDGCTAWSTNDGGPMWE